MEGLGGAAAIIQLAGTVRDLHHFLKNVIDAPNELKRLIFQLENLNAILHGIESIVQNQQNAGFGEAAITDVIQKALEPCRSIVSKFSTVIEQSKRLSSGSGSRFSRSWESLRLAYRKKDILEMESCLQQAISTLTLTMSMNMIVVHQQTAITLGRQIQEKSFVEPKIENNTLVAKRQPSNNDKLDHSISRRLRRNFGKREEYTTSWSCMTAFGELTVGKRYSKGPRTKKSTYWCAGFGRAVFLELCALSTWGSVGRSISVSMSMDIDDMPLGLWSAAVSADIPALQTHLYNNPGLLNTKFSNHALTLFDLVFYAQLSEAVQAFQFLLELVPKDTETMTCPISSLGCDWTPLGSTREELDCFLAAKGGPSVDEVRYIFDPLYSIRDGWNPLSFDAFSRLVDELAAPYDMPELGHFWARCLAANFAITPDDIRWSSMIRRLLNLGVDFKSQEHAGSNALALFFQGTDYWDSEHIGDRWLKMLEENGVDSLEYIEAVIEAPVRKVEHEYPCIWWMKCSKNPPRLFLVPHEPDPAVPGHLLLQVFPIITRYQRSMYRTSSPTVRPFGPLESEMSYITWPGFGDLDGDRKFWGVPENMSKTEFVQRHYRRMRLKGVKRQKKERRRGSRTMKIPGSWMD